MVEHFEITVIAVPPRVAAKSKGKAGGRKRPASDDDDEDCDAREVLKEWLALWEKRGWAFGPGYFSDMLTARVPVRDKGWRKDFERAVKAGAVKPLDDKAPLLVIPQYEESDRAAAKMFKLFHSGRYIDVPEGRDKKTAVCHVADFDPTPRCPKCGGGVVQVSNLRVAASELDRCNRLGSVWYSSDTFYLLADELVKNLEKAVGESLPKRAVEATGKRKPKQRWWQLDPAESLPRTAVGMLHGKAVPCSQRGCGRVYEDYRKSPTGLTHIERYISSGLPRRLPVCAWSPVWHGDFETFADGRVVSTPRPVLVYVRRDLAMAFEAEKVHGVELTPLLMA